MEKTTEENAKNDNLRNIQQMINLVKQQVIAKQVLDMNPNSAKIWDFRISGIKKNKKTWWIII